MFVAPVALAQDLQPQTKSPSSKLRLDELNDCSDGAHDRKSSRRKPLRQRGYQNNPTQLEHGYLHRTTRASHGAPRAPNRTSPTSRFFAQKTCGSEGTEADKETDDANRKSGERSCCETQRSHSKERCSGTNQGGCLGKN